MNHGRVDTASYKSIKKSVELSNFSLNVVILIIHARLQLINFNNGL